MGCSYLLNLVIVLMMIKNSFMIHLILKYILFFTVFLDLSQTESYSSFIFYDHLLQYRKLKT